MTSKRRGTITYCHTLVRPGYCSDCLGKDDLPASQRMESWSRDHALWIHMHHHMIKYEWPRPCPDPMCVREASLRDYTAPQFKDQEDLQSHLIDEHGYSRTRLCELTCPDPRQLRTHGDPASTAHESPRPNRKRKSSSREWMLAQYETTLISEDCLSPPRPRKRTREMTPTICPPLLSTFVKRDDERPVQMDLNEIAPPPVYIPDDACLGLVDLTLESEHTGRHRTSKCDASDPLEDASTDSHTDINTLFSQYLRSPSPSPSTESHSECSGETLVARDGEDSSPNPLAKASFSAGLGL